MCRSRRELSNEYLLAKFGVDTAENEPLEVGGKIQFTIHFTPQNLSHAELFGHSNPCNAFPLFSCPFSAILTFGSSEKCAFVSWISEGRGVAGASPTVQGPQARQGLMGVVS